MEVRSREPVEILLPNLGQSGLFVTVATVEALPEQRAGLPIQHLHLARFARIVVEPIRKAVWKPFDYLKRCPLGFVGKHLSLHCLIPHFGELCRIPLALLLFPDEVPDPLGPEHGE